MERVAEDQLLLRREMSGKEGELGRRHFSFQNLSLKERRRKKPEESVGLKEGLFCVIWKRLKNIFLLRGGSP